MKSQPNSIWDSFKDHEVYPRSLILFPYPKLPSISKPSAEFSDFASLGYKPLVGDTNNRPFLKAKVLRDQENLSARMGKIPKKKDHRIDSKFSESQKIRFITQVKNKEAIEDRGQLYRNSQTQCSPVENTLQTMNNDMRRTYDKQAKLKELIKK